MKALVIFVLLAAVTVETFCKTFPTPQFKKAGNESGSKSKSGPKSGSADQDIDWVDVILKQCDINLSEMDEEAMFKPVSYNDMSGAIRNISSYMDTALGVLQSNTPLLDTVVAQLADASLADLVAHHDVFDKFRGAALNATTGGVCHFVKLFTLVERLNIAGGGPGFSKDGNCDKSLKLLMRMYSSNNGDYDQILDMLSKNLTSLRRLSGAVTADMSCIIADLSDFKDFVILMNATTGSNLTMRQVLIGVAGIEAWGGIVVKQIYTYYYVVEHFMLILQHVQPEAKIPKPTKSPIPEPTTPPPATDFDSNLMRLKALLDEMDQW